MGRVLRSLRRGSTFAVLAAACGRSEGGGDHSPAAGGQKSASGGTSAEAGTSGRVGAGGSLAGSGVTGGTSGRAGGAGTAAGGARGGTSGREAGAGAAAGAAGDEGGAASGAASGKGSGTGGHGPGGCVGGLANGALTQLNLLIMFDRSWSMTECAAGSDTGVSGGDPRCQDMTMSRWALTSAALIRFVEDPSAAELGVALRFFPDDHPTAGCDGYPTASSGFGGSAGSTSMGNCDASACAMPLVELGKLTADAAPNDEQEQKLVTAIQNSPPPDVAALNPDPQTPTSAALAGATQWATAYQAAHPSEATAIILITDGEPAGCDTNVKDIAGIAATAYAAGISTYVIGLGINSDVLDQIAASGGTDRAFAVSNTSNVTSDLLQELNAIRGRARSCNVAIPRTTSGMAVDPNTLTVEFAAGDGTTHDLAYVSGADQCGTEPSFYYDDPAMPAAIILCPSTCDTVTGDASGAIELLVACAAH